MALNRLERTREHLKTEVRRWAKLLIPAWNLQAHYMDPNEWRKEHSSEDEPDNWLVLAQTWTRWEYGRVRVDFNLEGLSPDRPEKQTKTVIHELIHPIVQELRDSAHLDDGQEHLERVVTALTDAFCRTATYWYRKGLTEKEKKS